MRLALLFALVLLSSQAGAQGKGNDIWSIPILNSQQLAATLLAPARDSPQKANAIGYIEGFYDYKRHLPLTTAEMFKNNPRVPLDVKNKLAAEYFCVPSGTNREQLTESVTRYLKQGEIRVEPSIPAWYSVNEALREAFPCTVEKVFSEN